MTLLLFLFRTSRWLVFSALVASLASGFGNAALVALINRALNGDSEDLGVLGLEFAAVALSVLGTSWLSQLLFVRLSQDTLAKMRLHVSALVAEAPYRQIEAQGPARLFAILSDDIRTVSDFFVTLPNFTMHGAVVLGCLLYLGLLSWQVFLFALAVTVLGGLGYHVAHVRALGHLRAARSQQDELFRAFRALHDGAKELKLHRGRRAAFLGTQLERSIQGVRTHHTRGMSIYAASESWGVFLFFAFIGCVLFVARRYMTMEPEVLTGYALVFLHMLLPLDAVLGALPSVNRARVALERVEQGVGKLTAPARVLPPEQPIVPLRSLELRGVTHRYYREQEDGVFTLGPLHLHFEPGELVFLIGGNGSGKTTLAKLLVGLYAPDDGAVIWNGKPVEDAELYRQNFACVFSDFFLFDELIGVTSPATELLAQRWLHELKLERKVKIENGKFSTLELSQGQRKRLALLVACLEDRPFYVFDEWAADQDPGYREIFYAKILPDLCALGKTVLAITHDDRYFQLADRVLSLESGQIVGDSGHRQSRSAPTPVASLPQP
jgi:putative pyoverdin transport system ATP-binding/permease protein